MSGTYLIPLSNPTNLYTRNKNGAPDQLHQLLTCIVTPRTVSKKEHELIATKLGM
jgi:hypothetical protein